MKALNINGHRIEVYKIAEFFEYGNFRLFGHECEEVCKPIVEYPNKNYTPIERFWPDTFDSDSDSY